ncbi:MAG: PQQ-like beta-propeller repeat protein [Gemmataceae bacterium]|nr:PQQ-like beta-propeller repeat protein [Gemmataceae bacterium]
MGGWSTIVVLACAVAAGPDEATTANSTRDWPQWRGSHRDGICRETGLLQEWPAEGPPLLWKSTGRGAGYSTPTVVAGRVYGMGNRGDDEVVWCLDLATGNQLWVSPVAPKPARAGGGYEGPRCSPAFHDGKLYALGIQGDLACFEAATGKKVWSLNYKTRFAGRMMSTWGFSESPYIDDGKLIITPGGPEAAIAAVKLTDGSTVWTAKAPEGGGAGYSSIVEGQVGKTKYYATWLKSRFVGVAADSGKLLFEYPGVANTTANIPTAIVRDDHVFVTTGYSDGGAALLKLTAKPDGSIDATPVWKRASRELQNHHGGAVLLDGHLYFGHGHNQGNPVCVEFLTGKPKWGPTRGPGTGSAAVLAADGRLYFRYQNGLMALFDATPRELRVISTFTLPDQSGKPSWPHPVISAGRLLIRDQDTLLCYDVRRKS